MKVSVYQIANKLNGKSYIGITTNFERRMKDHQCWTGKYPVQQALKKYGKDNFDFLILEKVFDWEEGCKREKHYISTFKTKSPNGYNLTDGGDGAIGIKSWNKGKTGIYSEETLNQISRSLKEYYQDNPGTFKDKNHSEKSKELISDSCKKTMTDERRKEISENNKGRKQSEETKRKRGLYKTGKYHHSFGKSQSETHRKNNSIAHKGKGKGKDNGFYDCHHTDESKKLIGDTHRGNTYNLGREFSKEHINKLKKAKQILSDDQVRKIRIFLKEGMKQVKIAKIFNVNSSIISAIKIGKTYQNIK